MRKNLLPILEFRNKKLDLSAYEEELGFNFPPIYGSFLSNFNPEPKKQLVYFPRNEDEKKFIRSDFRLISQIAYSSTISDNLTREDDELGLITFKSIDDLLEFCVPDEPDIEDMIFISDHESADALLVGIGEHNQDQIFIYSELNENEWVEYFAKNIFDLLCDCQIIEDHLDEYWYGKIRPIDSQNLYKNWGEDFWRLREDK